MTNDNYMTLQTLLQSKTINRKTDLIDIARTGISINQLENVMDFTSLSIKELAEILPISQRQLDRYPSDHLLNKEITSHLLQLIEMNQKGQHLFGKEKFNIWMRTPNKVLNQNRPIDILDTSIGIEIVEDIIGRIEHGVYS